jgi:hypothetical protein
MAKPADWPKDAWRPGIAEAERRVEALDRGEMRSIPWEEARKTLGL